MTALGEDKRIEILSDLVSIQSVNDNETDVAEYILSLFSEYGIESKILNVSGNRSNLVAEIGSGKPVLAVTGHMDVVDPGDVKEWDSNPFELTERDGNLYARGASDMKSGLAALVIAMIESKENTSIQGTIRLLATVGEEVGEAGSYSFYKEGYMDDVDGLIVAEPSGYIIAHAQKGSLDIKLTAKGVAAHSSLPEMGYNAIDSLLVVLNEANQIFRDANNPKSDLLGELKFNTDVINGGVQVNSIADSASAEINVRTIPEFNNDTVLEKMQSIIDEYNLEHKTDLVNEPVHMEIMMNEPSVEEPADSKLVSIAKGVCEKTSNSEVPVIGAPGITDASNLLRDKGNDFPFMVFGPGNQSMHQVNEYVDKEMYFNFINMYISIFKEYIG